jgi:predicted CoA-binding protein
MSTMPELVSDFLAQKRIAVVGVSRSGSGTANGIYQRLKATGHEVVAVNPNADTVEGDPCFHRLQDIPQAVDAVMIVTTPDVTDQVVRDCHEAGIKRVWMHCSVMHGVRSTSDAAVQFCRDNGIAVIPTGCPMMFDGNVDVFHKFMHWWMRRSGKLAL